MSVVTSPSFSFRTLVHVVQIPARKVSGWLSSIANQASLLRSASVFSLNQVIGTRQRFSTPVQRRQCDELRFRMLVTPGSVLFGLPVGVTNVAGHMNLERRTHEIRAFQSLIRTCKKCQEVSYLGLVVSGKDCCQEVPSHRCKLLMGSNLIHPEIRLKHCSQVRIPGGLQNHDLTVKVTNFLHSFFEQGRPI